MSDRSTETLRRAVPRFSRLLPSVLFGIGSAGSSIALLAASAWLIARAAEQPPVLYLGLGIVGVRAFALGRAVFRYLERLTGHDASFRQLATIRAGVFERLLPIAPDGLAASRRGDLLARFVDDVDELQNVPLRVVQPVVSAAIVLVLAVVGVAFLAPESAWAVLACLVVGIAATLLVQRRSAMTRPAHACTPSRRTAGGGRRTRPVTRRARRLRCCRGGSPAHRRHRRQAREGDTRSCRGDRRRLCRDGRRRRIRRGGEPRGLSAAARVGPHRRADLRRAVPRSARDRRGRRRDPAGVECAAPRARERRARRECRAR